MSADAPLRPPLDAAALRDGLVGPGMPWRQLDVVAETGSTNADLITRSVGGADIDGSVLFAEHQNAARGRHGRQWSAPPGAQIAVSVGVDATSVPPSGWGWLPLATGVAVADALTAVAGIRANLKWPNDVLVGGGKLAGILAEVAGPTTMRARNEPEVGAPPAAQRRGGERRKCPQPTTMRARNEPEEERRKCPQPAALIVVGLGLNVTLTVGEAPGLAATSLLMLGSSVTDRNILARQILRELASRIEAWRTAGGADSALVADYQRYSVTLGSRVQATLPGDRKLVGRAESVDEMGRLCIDTGGEVVTISAADITHLRPGI